MKTISPIILGGIIAAFGDELQNWIVVFVGGVTFGVGMMYFVGVVASQKKIKP